MLTFTNPAFLSSDMDLGLNLSYNAAPEKKTKKAVFGNRKGRMQFRRQQKMNKDKKIIKRKNDNKPNVSNQPADKPTKPVQVKPLESDEDEEPKVKKPKQDIRPTGPKKFSTVDTDNPVATISKSVDRLFKDLPECESIAPPEKVNKVTEVMFDTQKFSSITEPEPLHPYLVKNLAKKGLDTMTKVQRDTLPHALEGKDILVKAQTGSGKTLVYTIPILHKLGTRETKISRSEGPYALVICPTRELALQSFETIESLARETFTWIIPGIVNGGLSRQKEKARIRKGINILVGTPGRIYDHLRQTEALTLANIEYLVIDEADRLFEQVFEQQVREIINKVKEVSEKKIQTFLLSATLSSGVETLAGLTLTNPITVDLGADKTADNLNADDFKSLEAEIFSLPKQLEQKICFSPLKLRFVTLLSLLMIRLQKGEKTVVFFSCIEEVRHFGGVFAVLLKNYKDKILSLHWKN